MSDFVDKFKTMIGIQDYEDDEYYDEENIDELKLEEEDKVRDVSGETEKNNNNNVVNISSNNKSMKIVIHEPKNYDEGPKVIDDLKARKVVVVNFEGLDQNTKRQIFDFINGGLYAIEGKIQKVTTDIFIVAPKTVYIDGLKDQLKDTGIFNW